MMVWSRRTEDEDVCRIKNAILGSGSMVVGVLAEISELFKQATTQHLSEQQEQPINGPFDLSARKEWLHAILETLDASNSMHASCLLSPQDTIGCCQYVIDLWLGDVINLWSTDISIFYRVGCPTRVRVSVQYRHNTHTTFYIFMLVSVLHGD